MIINEPGTYTLKYTATDDCGKTSTVDRELVVTVPIYGAEWDGSQSSAWTRTDASALFADPVPQYSDGNGGWIGGSSPFDDIYPWSDMEIVEDAEAGTLVSIPKFYYKWTRDDAKMKLQISPNPQEGFFVSPAHMDRGDGVGERDVVYVSRYFCANDFKSKSGFAPVESRSRASCRTNIHALGTEVWQYDFAMYWTIAMLYLVEFANWDSQSLIGVGGTNGSSYDTGATDVMTYHTGTVATSKSIFGDIQYRHIEGLWSNANFWCDGIYFNNRAIYAIKNPSDFSDTANGVYIGDRPTTQNEIIKSYILPPTGFEYALYVSETTGDQDYRYYTTDVELYTSAGIVLLIGSSQGADAYGLFFMNGMLSANSSGYGWSCRLMKLPSA